MISFPRGKQSLRDRERESFSVDYTQANGVFAQSGSKPLKMRHFVACFKVSYARQEKQLPSTDYFPERLLVQEEAKRREVIQITNFVPHPSLSGIQRC